MIVYIYAGSLSLSISISCVASHVCASDTSRCVVFYFLLIPSRLFLSLIARFSCLQPPIPTNSSLLSRLDSRLIHRRARPSIR
jgi:hypothetical protein